VDGRTSIRTISRNTGLSHDSLLRHRDNGHIAPSRAAVAAEEAENRSASLVGRAEALFTEAQLVLATAKNSENLAVALSAIRECSRVLDLIARMRGVIDTSTTVNLVMAPQFVTVQGVLIAALEPYPEARAAVTAALAQVR